VCGLQLQVWRLNNTGAGQPCMTSTRTLGRVGQPCVCPTRTSWQENNIHATIIICRLITFGIGIKWRHFCLIRLFANLQLKITKKKTKLPSVVGVYMVSYNSATLFVESSTQWPLHSAMEWAGPAYFYGSVNLTLYRCKVRSS